MNVTAGSQAEVCFCWIPTGSRQMFFPHISREKFLPQRSFSVWPRISKAQKRPLTPERVGTKVKQKGFFHSNKTIIVVDFTHLLFKAST